MAAAFLLAARAHLDLEAVRLDRQRLLQVHLIPIDIEQLEPLQDHPDRERGFMHCKAAADARPLAVAERLPRVDGTRRLGLAAEVFRIECVRVRSPYAG